jgi:PKD repeat protein
MRSLHLLALVSAAAVFGTACGDDGGGNGPDNVAPTATFTAPACQVGTACTFTDASTDSDGNIASRTWEFENGTPATSTQATQAVTFSADGAQTVRLTVTDNEGATDDFSLDVNVTAAPGGNQPPVASFTAVCTSQDCDFTSTSTDDGTIASYLWDFGDGSPTSTEQNPSHTYDVDALTTVTVRLTVTDDEGATATTTNDVTPAPPASLTCGTTPDCELELEADARVTVTLVSSDCELSGNTFKVFISAPGGGTPVEETLFTDGCNTPDNTQYQLQTNAVFAAGTTIQAQVISGGTILELPPAIRVTGTYPTWTLEFDDGAQSEPPEPDFNDLVLTIQALP